MSENKMQYGGYEYRLVDPNLLRADPTYQRQINVRKIYSIVENFNIKIFNEPKVSKRPDGYYYVFDGDHSIAAHKIMFGKDTPIKCKVYYGLSKEEEMRLFVAQNGISSNPTRIAKLQALANYDDPKVKDMMATARDIGISIEFHASPGPNKILAADTAYRVFELLGRDDFRAMLQVIQKAWNGDGESFQMGMLKGFGYIYQHCGPQVRRLSTDEFAKPFAGFPVSKIVERSRTLTGTMDRRFAVALLEQYNKKKRSGKITLPTA